ncbi:diguanylate cyclase [uncultured Marinobacter sp.]
MAVLMLDLDHFKQVNDQWGHATGDKALQMVARINRVEFGGTGTT